MFMKRCSRNTSPSHRENWRRKVYIDACDEQVRSPRFAGKRDETVSAKSVMHVQPTGAYTLGIAEKGWMYNQQGRTPLVPLEIDGIVVVKSMENDNQLGSTPLVSLEIKALQRYSEVPPQP
jgi:hypothetical protein